MQDRTVGLMHPIPEHDQVAGDSRSAHGGELQIGDRLRPPHPLDGRWIDAQRLKRRRIERRKRRDQQRVTDRDRCRDVMIRRLVDPQNFSRFRSRQVID